MPISSHQLGQKCLQTLPNAPGVGEIARKWEPAVFTGNKVSHTPTWTHSWSERRDILIDLFKLKFVLEAGSRVGFPQSLWPHGRGGIVTQNSDSWLRGRKWCLDGSEPCLLLLNFTVFFDPLPLLPSIPMCLVFILRWKNFLFGHAARHVGS